MSQSFLTCQAKCHDTCRRHSNIAEQRLMWRQTTNLFFSFFCRQEKKKCHEFVCAQISDVEWSRIEWYEAGMLSDILVWRGLGLRMTWHFQTTRLNLFSGIQLIYICSSLQTLYWYLYGGSYLAQYLSL